MLMSKVTNVSKDLAASIFRVKGETRKNVDEVGYHRFEGPCCLHLQGEDWGVKTTSWILKDLILTRYTMVHLHKVSIIRCQKLCNVILGSKLQCIWAL